MEKSWDRVQERIQMLAEMQGGGGLVTKMAAPSSQPISRMAVPSSQRVMEMTLMMASSTQRNPREIIGDLQAWDPDPQGCDTGVCMRPPPPVPPPPVRTLPLPPSLIESIPSFQWSGCNGMASTDEWSCAGCGTKVKLEKMTPINELIVTCFIVCPDCAKKNQA